MSSVKSWTNEEFARLYEPISVKNLKKKKCSNGKTILDSILDDLEEAGYAAEYRVLNAKDFGVPQSRERVIIVGVRKEVGVSTVVNWPVAVPDFDATYGSILHRDDDEVKEATGTYDVYMTRKKIEYYVDRKNELPQYVKWVDPDKVSGTVRAGYGKSRGAEALVIRDHDGNIMTSVTNPDDVSSMRMLTLEECMALQSFPATYIVHGPRLDQYTQNGNAVPPTMAYNVAKAVFACSTPVVSTSDVETPVSSTSDATPVVSTSDIETPVSSTSTATPASTLPPGFDDDSANEDEGDSRQNKRRASFCIKCGTDINGVAPDANFCPNCGSKRCRLKM